MSDNLIQATPIAADEELRTLQANAQSFEAELQQIEDASYNESLPEYTLQYDLQEDDDRARQAADDAAEAAAELIQPPPNPNATTWGDILVQPTRPQPYSESELVRNTLALQAGLQQGTATPSMLWLPKYNADDFKNLQERNRLELSARETPLSELETQLRDIRETVRFFNVGLDMNEGLINKVRNDYPGDQVRKDIYGGPSGKELIRTDITYANVPPSPSTLISYYKADSMMAGRFPLSAREAYRQRQANMPKYRADGTPSFSFLSLPSCSAGISRTSIRGPHLCKTDLTGYSVTKSQTHGIKGCPSGYVLYEAVKPEESLCVYLGSGLYADHKESFAPGLIQIEYNIKG